MPYRMLAMCDRNPLTKTDASPGGRAATGRSRVAGRPHRLYAPAKTPRARGGRAEKIESCSRIHGAPHGRVEELPTFFRSMAPIEVSGTSARVWCPGRPSYGSLGGCSRGLAVRSEVVHAYVLTERLRVREWTPQGAFDPPLARFAASRHSDRRPRRAIVHGCCGYAAPGPRTV